MTYVWERTEWPTFHWDEARLLEPVAEARHAQGRLLGKLAAVGFELGSAAQLDALTSEVVKSSEIEGELLNAQSVRSSVARQLGLPDAGITAPEDRRVEGVVALALDVTRNWHAPLDERRLFGWHAALFPAGYSGLHPVRAGTWRDDASGPMQVVSGPVGRTHVHFSAPPADRVPNEMKRFLEWFNAPPRTDGLLRAGIAHLWFVTIHPFDDGNGRIARAVTELALAQLERSEHRYYSLSTQIRRDRAAYYEVLEATQKGELDITAWLLWFVATFARAIEAAELKLKEVLHRSDFWRKHADVPFNARQLRVLNAFVSGFEGALTARKWAALAKCSVDTAQRDLADLVARGVLVKNPGGSKKTSYSLAL